MKKKIKASLETQIMMAERMITRYAENVRVFESGELTPDIGELTANRLLLARKRKQLAKLKGQLAVRRGCKVELACGKQFYPAR